MGKELILDKSKDVINFESNDIAIAPYLDRKLDATKERIRIEPEHLGLNIVRYIILTLNAKESRKLAGGTIRTHLRLVRKLFDYLETFYWDETLNDDLTRFNIEFLKYLQSRASTGNAAASSWNVYLSLIQRGNALVDAYKYKNDQITDLLDKKRIEVRHGSSPTLCQLYPQLGVEDDRAALNGCTEVMCWLLNEFTYLRKSILDNLPEELEQHLDEIKRNKIRLPSASVRVEDLNDENANFYGYFTTQRVTHPKNSSSSVRVKITSAKLNSTYLQTLLSTGDDVHTEIVCEQVFPRHWYFENGLNVGLDALSNEINQLFINKLWKDGKQVETKRNSARWFGASKAFPSLCNRCPRGLLATPIAFLFSHSEVEEQAMQWLLAAGRSQLSGIEKLSVSGNVDWNKDRGTIQIVNVQKDRRNNRSKGQHSDIFRRNELQYDVLTDWVEVINKSQNYISNIDDSFFIHQVERNSWVPNLDPIFRLLAHDGSRLNSKIKEDYKGYEKEDGVELFLKILKEHCKHRAVGFGSLETPRVTIGTRCIAQTRAIVLDREVDYNLVGHTEDTHRDIYLKRTTSVYVQSKIAYWASAIGNAFIEEAQSLYSSTRPLSVKEAKEVLKIKDFSGQTDIDEIQEIIDKAEGDGYVADLAGILNSNEKNIVLMTPMTCALVLARIQHIYKEVAQIEISNRSKVFHLLTQLMFLNLVANQFSDDQIANAEEINQEYELPFARMV